MLRLRRAGQINGQQVPEIIILNSHDGASSFQLLPGIFRSVCTNSLVCGQSFGEIRVPHRGDVVGKVIEGAYQVLSVLSGWKRNVTPCSPCNSRHPHNMHWLKRRSHIVLGKSTSQ